MGVQNPKSECSEIPNKSQAPNPSGPLEVLGFGSCLVLLVVIGILDFDGTRRVARREGGEDVYPTKILERDTSEVQVGGREV